MVCWFRYHLPITVIPSVYILLVLHCIFSDVHYIVGPAFLFPFKCSLAYAAERTQERITHPDPSGIWDLAFFRSPPCKPQL